MIFFQPTSIPEWHGPRRVYRLLGDDAPAPKAEPKPRPYRRRGPYVWPGRWRPWRLIEPGMPPVSAKGIALLWRVR